MDTWQTYANCLSVDPEAFFPSHAGGYKSPLAAMRICQECPVRQWCLYENFDLPHGVVGGLSENQRRKMHRDKLRPPVPPPFRLRDALPQGEAEVRVALAGGATS